MNYNGDTVSIFMMNFSRKLLNSPYPKHVLLKISANSWTCRTMNILLTELPLDMLQTLRV